ncbi:hypothetical protein Tco_0091935, partial [Tanacetum coccineum]
MQPILAHHQEDYEPLNPMNLLCHHKTPVLSMQEIEHGLTEGALKTIRISSNVLQIPTGQDSPLLKKIVEVKDYSKGRRQLMTLRRKNAEAVRKVHSSFHVKNITEFVPHHLLIQEIILRLLALSSGCSFTQKNKKPLNVRMKLVKESIGKSSQNTNRGTGDLNEGTCSKPRVIDESIVTSATSSEGTSVKPGVPNEDKDNTEEKMINMMKLNLMKMISKSIRFMYEQMRMKECQMQKLQTSEVKDDTKNTELPPSSSSLSVSLGFGDQFLKTSSDTSLIGIVKDSTDVEPSVLTPIPETPSATTVTTSPPLSLRVANLEKDVSKLKKFDISAEAFAALKTHVPTDKYSLMQALESSKIKTPTINLEQESEKSPSNIFNIKKEQAEKQQKPQFTIKSIDKEDLEEFNLKRSLYQHMHANKSFNINHANHRLYHALMEALIKDKNAMDKGVVDTLEDHKIKHDG